MQRSRSVPRTTAAVGALAALVVGAGTARVADAGSSAEEITIGVLAPITGGGAGIGEAATLGVEFATDEINANGGIDGRQINLEIADDQGDPTTGVTEATRLLTQVGIDAAVGPAYSQVTLATLPLFTDANVFTVNLTGSEDLTPEVSPLSFSLLVNASSQVEMLVQEAVAQGHTSVAFISDNGPQAQTALAAAEQQLDEAGIELTGSQQYTYDATDMTPQLLDLREGEPEALLAFTSTGDHSGYILQGRTELNWDIPIIGGYGFALSGPAIEIAGEEAFDGVTGINYAAFTYCEDEGVAEPVEQFITGVQGFDTDVSSRVDLNYVSLWYDAIYTVKQAIEANDGSTDGETLANWLAGGEPINVDVGVNRNISASAEDHFLIGLDQLAVVHPAQLIEGGVQQRVHCD